MRGGTRGDNAPPDEFGAFTAHSLFHTKGPVSQEGASAGAVIFERFIPFLSKKYSFFSVTVSHTILIDIFKIFS